MATESASYRIAYGCSFILVKAVKGFLSLLWTGTVKISMKNKLFLIVYGFLLLATILSFIIWGDGSIVISIIFLLAFALGLWEYIKERPIRKQRKYFNKLFTQIGLVSKENVSPYFLYAHELTPFITKIAFNSFLPLSMWESKKELIALHMNEKIIDIKQDSRNYQIISLIIQNEPLPDMVHWNDKYMNDSGNVLNIGVGYYGFVGMDLEKYPHAFIAGETGSGKSNILKCLIHQAILKDYDVILIDFKRGVSFSAFGDMLKVYYDYQAILEVLKEMVEETNKRLDLFWHYKIDNLNDYNKVSGDYLHRKIIFIDELAELLKTRDKALSNILNDSIETLTRLSRATGINLIMGIQRPDSTVISGQIKNNVSYRVCGRFVDNEPSRIMLGDSMASTLPNIKGRFIVKDDGLQEVQSFYFSNDDITSPSHNTLKESEIRQEKQEDTKENINNHHELNFDFNDIKK